jgi:hypothetical protein
MRGFDVSSKGGLVETFLEPIETKLARLERVSLFNKKPIPIMYGKAVQHAQNMGCGLFRGIPSGGLGKRG